MIVKNLGMGVLDFISADGKAIKGTNLYVCYPSERVMGFMTDRFFVNSTVKLPDDLKSGDQLEISFTNKGKVESVTKVK